MGREGDEADVAVSGILPALEFGDVGRADVVAGVGSARSVFGFDVGSFDVEASDNGVLLLRGSEVAKAGEHVIGGTGDDGGEAAGDAGREDGFEGVVEVGGGGVRVVEIDASEAVDLEMSWFSAKGNGRTSRMADSSNSISMPCPVATSMPLSVLFTLHPQGLHSMQGANAGNRTRKKLLKWAGAR
jgi:hypothetical protein